MVWRIIPLELVDENGKTGRFRVTALSDKGDERGLCYCENGHDSAISARECPQVRERLEMYNFRKRSA